MKLFVLGVLLAILGWWTFGVRKRLVARQRLLAFFAERNIQIIDIRRPNHITYGHPGYVVVFGSIPESASFAKSVQYEEFLHAVHELHSSQHRDFDGRKAVALYPPQAVSSDAG